MKRKWLSLLLVLALLLGMMPAAVFATDDVLEIAMDDLTLIGVRDSEVGDPDEVYVFDDADLTGITALDFSPIVGEDDEFDGFIMPLGNNYALYTDSCIVEDYADYIIDADYFTDENFEAEDEWENIDFSEYLGFYVYYDEGILNVLIPKPVGIFNEYGFILSVGEVTDVEEDGCTIASWDGTSSDVDLLTVTVPFGTEAVEFTFEEARLAYGYGDPSDYDSYLCACAPTEDGAYADINAGETSAVVKMQENYQLPPYVFVQTPYDENWSSTTLFAVTFEYSYTFTAKVDGTACEIVKVEPGAYEYFDYMAMQTVYVPVYTVAVPYGTENVDITLSDPGLLYNYDGAGNWLAGWYTDTTYTGQTEFTVAVDANDDGASDYIQVQKYYNEEDYSGGDLYYAVTFEEEIPFTASAGEVGEKQENAYEVTPWGADPYTVPVYPLTIREDVNEVTFTFPEDRIAYAYDENGEYITDCSGQEGGYDNYGQTGLLTAVVRRADDGTMPPYVVVQTPYDENWESTTLFAIQIIEEELPFTASAGEIGAKQDDAYEVTPYGADPYTVPVYPLTITDDVDQITFTFPETRIAYAYDENGGYITDCSGQEGGYDNYGQTGLLTGVVHRTDDGTMPPYVVVQTPYDENWSSTTLFAIHIIEEEVPEPPAPIVHKEDIDEDVQELLDTLLAPDESRPATDYTADWALAMRAAGKTPTEAEMDAFLQNAMAAARSANTQINSKAKWAIALSALGIDATQIPGEDGEVIDLVADVYNASEEDILNAFGADAYTAPVIVDLYELDLYDIPEDVLSEDFLVELILNGQEETGGWYGDFGADATGMVLYGLAPLYDSNESVKTAIDNAVAYLLANEADDGSMPGYNGSPSVGTNAFVSIGLHALGINDHLGDYIKDDCPMGWLLSKANNGSYGNRLDNMEAAGALATFQNLEGNRNQNLYHFDGTVSVCTDWPDADLLTGIAVTTLPDKTVYEIGETFDPAGLVVTATYNADPENTEVIEEGYTLSEPDMTTAGNKTVTVTYQGQTATFVITVRSAGGGDAGEYAYITVKGLDETFVAKTKEDIVAGETTALELLKSVLGREGIPYVIKNGGTYVASINGLAEFDEGPNSGWLYKVNGSLPGNGTMAASEYCLQNGDNLVWFYTKDYTQEDVVKPTLPSEQENTQKFIDVTEADWYDEYANKAAELGLFAGYEAGTDADGNKLYEFRGTETMTRAMFVTVLRAMETKLHGEPAEAPSAGFDDVKAGDWFEKGVNWAFEKGITAGKGEVFGVDDPVTREQMAVFVYLYAKQAGLVKGEPDLSKLDAFTDAGDISGYAKEAIAWLVGEGLMAGRGEGKLAPKASSTRAEVAAFMVSCCEYFAK